MPHGLPLLMEGSQGRKLQAGTEAEAVRDLCLLVSLHGSFNYLSYTAH